MRSSRLSKLSNSTASATPRCTGRCAVSSRPGSSKSRLVASDSGPARRYYAITRGGRQQLEAGKTWGMHQWRTMGWVKRVAADEYIRQVERGAQRSALERSGATSSPISATTSPNCRPRQTSPRGSGLPRSTPPISALRKASSVATGSAPTCAHGARATSSSSRSWSSYSHSRSDSRSPRKVRHDDRTAFIEPLPALQNAGAEQRPAAQREVRPRTRTGIHGPSSTRAAVRVRRSDRQNSGRYRGARARRDGSGLLHAARDFRTWVAGRPTHVEGSAHHRHSSALRAVPSVRHGSRG